MFAGDVRRKCEKLNLAVYSFVPVARTQHMIMYALCRTGTLMDGSCTWYFNLYFNLFFESLYYAV